MKGNTDHHDIISRLKDEIRSDDVVDQTMKKRTETVRLFYIASICDAKWIEHYIVLGFHQAAAEDGFFDYLSSFPNSGPFQNFDHLCEQVLQGSVAVVTDSGILLVPAVKHEASNVQEAKVELVLQGPRDAFTERLEDNLNLLRFRYKSLSLNVNRKQVGAQTSLKYAIVFDEKTANPESMKLLNRMLSSLESEPVVNVDQFKKKLLMHKWVLFPLYLETERPDRIVRNIEKGRIVILIEANPFAIVLPCMFQDFFISMEDVVQLPTVGKFLQTVRLTGIFLTISLPAVYVAVSSFNPELFRVQIALMISGSRSSVPYPAYLEVLFMLMMMEFLTEASARLPKAIGPAATTVGGLILGDAATRVGLVGNIMIIIVAAVAITNYVIPMNMMGFALRFIKYPLILLAAVFGLFGIIIGFVLLVFYACNLQSLGQPYLKLFVKNGE